MKLPLDYSRNMTKYHSGLVEEYKLPEYITILIDGKRQEPEYSGEYIKRIGEEFSESGQPFEAYEIAKMLRKIMYENYQDNTDLCLRIIQDEPNPI